ncbi:MAG TPA: tetratricopeptide repeat protein [Candidatus Acidoferrum sp.]|nr:tetratricopeptide repeat protein [Candidatus Acidoferrum sp.]
MRPIPLLTLFIALGMAAVGCDASHGGKSEKSPLIIFRNADGRTLTAEDLKGVVGTFRYEIVGDTNVPSEARSPHQQARQAGGQGDYKKALNLLERASALAPQWPYPVYDAAYTHLLMKDFDEARGLP